MPKKGSYFYTSGFVNGSDDTNEDAVDVDSDSDVDEDEIYAEPAALIRTQLLLLDYKQFKAARLIQKVIRGWMVRLRMERRLKAAIVIQRAWWRYLGKRYQTSMAQQMLQIDIVKVFNNYSVKIQSLYRGWYSRKYLNNMRYLKIIQISALEDIIRNMVLEMHSLHRRNELPGVHSFSSKTFIELNENFISTLSYRLFNRNVFHRMIVQKSIRGANRRQFLNSQFQTNVPFYGENELIDDKAWEPDPKFYLGWDMNVVSAFYEGQDANAQHNELKRRKMLLNLRLQKEVEKTTNFCKDVFTSMSGWSIFNNGELEITGSWLDCSINEFFGMLNEFLLSKNYGENCYCQRDTKPEGYFENLKL